LTLLKIFQRLKCDFSVNNLLAQLTPFSTRCCFFNVAYDKQQDLRLGHPVWAVSNLDEIQNFRSYTVYSVLLETPDTPFRKWTITQQDTDHYTPFSLLTNRLLYLLLRFLIEIDLKIPQVSFTIKSRACITLQWHTQTLGN